MSEHFPSSFGALNINAAAFKPAAPESTQVGNVFRKHKAPKPPAAEYRTLLQSGQEHKIIHKATELLNKLTLTNFSIICDQYLALLESEANGANNLNLLVDAILRMATDDTFYAAQLSDLVRNVSDIWTSLEPQDELSSFEASSSNKVVRTMGEVHLDMLISKWKLATNTLLTLMQEAAHKDDASKRSLSYHGVTCSMTFLCELCKRGLVPIHLLQEQCLEVLINTTHDELLVCLGKVLPIVEGKLSEHYGHLHQCSVDRGESAVNYFSAYMERIRRISVDHPNSRVRFFMHRLCTLHDNGWAPVHYGNALPMVVVPKVAPNVKKSGTKQEAAKIAK